MAKSEPLFVIKKIYLDLYKTLLGFSSKSSKLTAFNLYSIVKRISGKAQTYWKQYLFNTSSSAKIERDGLSTINDVSLFHKKDEKDFRLEFFQLLHLFKAKSLLDDYFDLNRRYFKTTDINCVEMLLIVCDVVNCVVMLLISRLPKCAKEITIMMREDYTWCILESLKQT